MEEALEGIRPGSEVPDVALVDIGLPGMDGIHGIRILKERFPEQLLLAHTVYDGDAFLTRYALGQTAIY